MPSRSPSQKVWGLDIALSHVAFGVAADPRGQPFVQHFKVHERPALDARLADLGATVLNAATTIKRTSPPLAVYVEQPSGAHRNQALVAAWGVILAALNLALQPTPFPTPIWTTPSSTWKAQVLGKGNGNAGKDLTRDILLRRWPSAQYLNEHELDAIGLAHFGATECWPA